MDDHEPEATTPRQPLATRQERLDDADAGPGGMTVARWRQLANELWRAADELRAHDCLATRRRIGNLLAKEALAQRTAAELPKGGGDERA
jgi:hypothetical protein